ncbi:Kdo hydroxylase family protein [Paracidobacterium acidisoli]|uniref:3-deoxy-D-manno-oct-2-ulosonic acid (Kdo) hydroxylase n=1 Tax=Paracidobacterium acidisoli TaxID=2303751 RepID=A0A372IMU3_9BACT|nr:Kdo hydroxylase family protein [Paracidobacterium acidisoli]MBT9331885.1 Kdo hydroxylase family protein [Paracidobacterium acidisoli]
MGLLTIPLSEIPDGRPTTDQKAREWCARLEAGEILFFPETPVPLAEDDIHFLLGQQQTDSSLHKNIAYKPNIDRLSGVDTKTADATAVTRLRSVMRMYSQAVATFLTAFLTPYNGNWTLDYASFRPQEEESRNLPLRRRNDLLHTDAFPTRPTHGARILRFFNNIHPTRTRDWMVSAPFADTVRQFAPKQIAPRPDSSLTRTGKFLGRAIGLGGAIPSLKRSPYDDFMMRFHNFLKENSAWQTECPKYSWKFPSGSSWMVYTDTVPHAVLAGQHALEQTFLVRPEAMVNPGVSPLKVLERIASTTLV